MRDFIETKDRLPEENSGRLEFTDGERSHKGYFRNGQFVAQLPPDAGTGAITEWHPQGILRWRPMEEGEL